MSMTRMPYTDDSSDAFAMHLQMEDSQMHIANLLEMLAMENYADESAQASTMLNSMEDMLVKFSDNHYEAQNEMNEMLESSRRGLLTHHQLQELVSAEATRSQHLTGILNSLKMQIENMYDAITDLRLDPEVDEAAQKEIAQTSYTLASKVELMMRSVTSLDRVATLPPKKINSAVSVIDSEVVMHVNKTKLDSKELNKSPKRLSAIIAQGGKVARPPSASAPTPRHSIAHNSSFGGMSSVGGSSTVAPTPRPAVETASIGVGDNSVYESNKAPPDFNAGKFGAKSKNVYTQTTNYDGAGALGSKPNGSTSPVPPSRRSVSPVPVPTTSTTTGTATATATTEISAGTTGIQDNSDDTQATAAHHDHEDLHDDAESHGEEHHPHKKGHKKGAGHKKKPAHGKTAHGVEGHHGGAGEHHNDSDHGKNTHKSGNNKSSHLHINTTSGVDEPSPVGLGFHQVARKLSTGRTPQDFSSAEARDTMRKELEAEIAITMEAEVQRRVKIALEAAATRDYDKFSTALGAKSPIMSRASFIQNVRPLSSQSRRTEDSNTAASAGGEKEECASKETNERPSDPSSARVSTDLSPTNNNTNTNTKSELSSNLNLNSAHSGGSGGSAEGGAPVEHRPQSSLKKSASGRKNVTIAPNEIMDAKYGTSVHPATPQNKPHNNNPSNTQISAAAGAVRDRMIYVYVDQDGNPVGKRVVCESDQAKSEAEKVLDKIPMLDHLFTQINDSNISNSNISNSNNNNSNNNDNNNNDNKGLQSAHSSSSSMKKATVPIVLPATTAPSTTARTNDNNNKEGINTPDNQDVSVLEPVPAIASKTQLDSTQLQLDSQSLHLESLERGTSFLFTDRLTTAPSTAGKQNQQLSLPSSPTQKSARSNANSHNTSVRKGAGGGGGGVLPVVMNDDDASDVESIEFRRLISAEQKADRLRRRENNNNNNNSPLNVPNRVNMFNQIFQGTTDPKKIQMIRIEAPESSQKIKKGPTTLSDTSVAATDRSSVESAVIVGQGLLPSNMPSTVASLLDLSGSDIVLPSRVPPGHPVHSNNASRPGTADRVLGSQSQQQQQTNLKEADIDTIRDALRQALDADTCSRLMMDLEQLLRAGANNPQLSATAGGHELPIYDNQGGILLTRTYRTPTPPATFIELLSSSDNPLMYLFQEYSSFLSRVQRARLLNAAVLEDRVKNDLPQSKATQLLLSKLLETMLVTVSDCNDMLTMLKDCEDRVQQFLDLLRRRPEQLHAVIGSTQMKELVIVVGEIEAMKVSVDLNLVEFRAFIERINAQSMYELDHLMKESTDFEYCYKHFLACQGKSVEVTQRLNMMRDRCVRHHLGLGSNSKAGLKRIKPTIEFDDQTSVGMGGVEAHIQEIRELRGQIDELKAQIEIAKEEFEDQEVEMLELMQERDRAPDALQFFALMHDPSYLQNLNQLVLQIKHLRSFADGSGHMDFITLRKRLQVCCVLTPSLEKLCERYALMYQKWSNYRLNWFSMRKLNGGSADAFNSCPLCFQCVSPDGDGAGSTGSPKKAISLGVTGMDHRSFRKFDQQQKQRQLQQQQQQQFGRARRSSLRSSQNDEVSTISSPDKERSRSFVALPNIK